MGEVRVALLGTRATGDVSVIGLPPGTGHRVLAAGRRTGALAVDVVGEGAYDVWCHVTRADGSDTEQSSTETWPLSQALRPAERHRLTRQVREAGEYTVVAYEASGACRVAEALVELAPGGEVEISLELRAPATFELVPPKGAVVATRVRLRRGEAHVVAFPQNPILPTPIALAPGPITVEWIGATGTRFERTVELDVAAKAVVELVD